jgi:hypothetical protein
MGHAHHFLSRLDRVELPHVELALSLYRDDALLRFILQSACIPEGAERIAISLEHPEEGPFIVITRDGHFVTCLGAGMSPGELHVIPRGQLDGLAAKLGVLRERIQACEALSGERGGAGKLLRRVYEAGDRLSREELRGIAAMQPLFRLEFLSFMLAANDDLREARASFERELRRAKKLDRRHDERLTAYWKVFWALGHLTVLVAMDGRDVIESLPELMQPQFTRDATLSWVSVRQGMFALAARGLWAAGRIGKVHLPAYKRRWAEASTFLTALDGAMGLAALGLRHTRLRAEVSKALASGPDEKGEGPLAEMVRILGQVALNVVEHATDEKERAALMRTQRGLGADFAVLIGSFAAQGSPYRFARAEDVPDDLAMCLAVNHPGDLVTNAHSSLYLASMLPWLSRASAEDLYLPAEYLSAVRMPFPPAERARAVLKAMQHVLIEGPPRTYMPRPEGPTRNGPCPCGSGKKYKRCCGAGGGD